jgi:cell division protease FtsH
MEENGRSRGFREIIVWGLLLAVPLAWLILVLPQSLSGTPPSIPISQVATGVEHGMVQGLSVQGDAVRVQYRNGAIAVAQKEPNQSLLDVLHAEGVTPAQLSAVSLSIVPDSPLGSIGLPIWIVVGLVVAGIVFLVTRQSPNQNGNDQTLSFLKSRARKITADRPKVKFDDAAGVEEAKQELREVVEFLKSPGRFAAVGARIPKGVLLVGPPGTGKTLLARAVAGEAGVPFFSISGSEFVELFVGVGASRVRDLFDQAKRHAPCIVFIDEIDAVGRQRGFGIGGGHDEREQTLNQILVEMDGFDKNTNVVVMAATNRADVLDPALLRPGRFDRRVMVDAPDLVGRRAILRIHARNKPLAADVDLDRLATETAGFSGADLENLVNEAAILAARSYRRLITDADFEDAIDRVIAGPERKTRRISEREKALTAYHEAGHAIAAHTMTSVDKVHKVTIIPRGQSGGHTRLIAEADRGLWSRSELLDTLVFILGGIAAEDLIFGETTTGPGSDLERATDLARRMVCEYGMSAKLGPVVLSRRDGYSGYDTGERLMSDVTAAEVDAEVRGLITGALARARAILDERREVLDRLANRLVKEETVAGERLTRVLDGLEIEDLPTPLPYSPAKATEPITLPRQTEAA